MLKLCENMSELDFLSPDPYAARISALAATYGFEQSFALFWVQYVDENPVAAVSRLDGAMSVFCGANTDFEELASFIKTVGFSTLVCREENMGMLGFEADNASYIVKYEGIPDGEMPNVLWDYDKKKIYELLSDCGFEMGSYGDFAADYCSRLNKGAAMLAAVENDELDACASALFIGKNSVLLGAVATRKEARGNGYASKAVKALANRLNDKSVFLFCRNDSLLAFYEKTGFVYNGKWAELRR